MVYFSEFFDYLGRVPEISAAIDMFKKKEGKFDISSRFFGISGNNF